MKKLDEVFRKSVKAYFKGVIPETLKGVQKRSKYTKKYFDAVEVAEFGSVTKFGKENK